MGNVLWNPTFSDRWDAYLGGGIGWAWTKFEPDFEGDEGDDFKDNAFAWQLIAGAAIRSATVSSWASNTVTSRPSLRMTSEQDICGPELCGFDVDGKIKSHSLLASLIFSWLGAAAVPPPPRRPASAAAATGDADLPGRLGDPGDGHAPPPPPPPPPPPNPNAADCPYVGGPQSNWIEGLVEYQLTMNH